jgi:hypothetical protein
VVAHLQAPIFDQGNLDGNRSPLVVAPEDLRTAASVKGNGLKVEIKLADGLGD